MKKTIWDAACLPRFEPLREDAKTDVLVIGGGMAGLLCAHMLHNAGADVMLIEQNRICSGVTGNTTAKVTMQHGLIYRKLLETYGSERAQQYAFANMDALVQFRRFSREFPFGWEEKNAYLYSIGDRQCLEAEAGALHRLGIAATLKDVTDLPFSVAGAVMVKHQGQMDPLQFAAGIAKGLNIYEHTAAIKIDGHTVLTNRGSIRADKVIVATHFPFINGHGSYFLKLYQHRSYVLALENAADVDGMYIGIEKNSLSFRNAGKVLLLGGGGHRTGKPGGGWQQLQQDAQQYYPQAREIAHWATQDCMSLDSMPYIGQYSKRTPNLYVATGFHKWGMTGSMAAARILTASILEGKDPYDGLFSPSRKLYKPQLARNALFSATNLLSFSTRRCPHMGCALKWNKQEHSWDCPCHGSRFSADGHLLDNPATEDLPE